MPGRLLSGTKLWSGGEKPTGFSRVLRRELSGEAHHTTAGRLSPEAARPSSFPTQRPLSPIRLVVMVRHIPQQAFRAVKLFQKDHPRQFVREGLRPEGDEVLRLFPHGIVQAEGAAHDEAGAARPVAGQSVQKTGKFTGGHGTPFLIEADWYILRPKGGKDALAFLFHAACREGPGRNP